MSLLLFLFHFSCLRQAQVVQTGLELLLFLPLPPPPVQGLQVFTTVSGFLIKKFLNSFAALEVKSRAFCMLGPSRLLLGYIPVQALSFCLFAFLGFVFQKKRKDLKKKKKDKLSEWPSVCKIVAENNP